MNLLIGNAYFILRTRLKDKTLGFTTGLRLEESFLGFFAMQKGNVPQLINNVHIGKKEKDRVVKYLFHGCCIIPFCPGGGGGGGGGEVY